MKQALHLLQLPVLELSTAIDEELSLNPILEISEDAAASDTAADYDEFEMLRTTRSAADKESKDLREFIENTLVAETSLFFHLLNQARETFAEEELKLAEILIGHIDERGFLQTSLTEIGELFSLEVRELVPLLEVIQTFDPPGVGARNLQECLLIQLRNKEGSAYQIISEHYEALTRNKIPQIAKSLGLNCEEVRKVIEEEISVLDLHPGRAKEEGHYRSPSAGITPDILIQNQEDSFAIVINEARVPQLRLSSTYLGMLDDPTLTPEARDYIHEKITSGKYFMRNIYERHQTLYRIAEKIVESQSSFFLGPEGKLQPMTMKQLAETLDLHESTIARACSNKYVDTPRGIYPLHYFFTQGYTSATGEQVSSESVKDLLREIISSENPSSPLSDEVIANRFKEKGISCARRTIAKYRKELGIGSTTERRLH